MAEFEFVDIVAAGILSLALLRGLFLGLVREACSLTAIALAYLAVQFYYKPVADGLVQISGGAISTGVAPWIAGALLVVLAITLVTAVGRILRRGVRAAGLGFLDRMAGGLLGTAEGVLVVAILFSAAIGLFGKDHPTLKDTQTLATLEQLPLALHEPPHPDVASPPPTYRQQ